MKPSYVLVSAPIHACDECNIEFNDKKNFFSCDVFPDDEAYTLDFCSWGCLFKHLPKVKHARFISLPFAQFDKEEGDKNFYL